MGFHGVSVRLPKHLSIPINILECELSEKHVFNRTLHFTIQSQSKPGRFIVSPFQNFDSRLPQSVLIKSITRRFLKKGLFHAFKFKNPKFLLKQQAFLEILLLYTHSDTTLILFPFYKNFFQNCFYEILSFLFFRS